MSKTVQFQTIQFSISMHYKRKYTVWLSKTFLFQAIQFSQRVQIQTIQFSISTQFSSIQPIDRTLIGCYLSGPEQTWEQWQWRGTPHSPKLQHYWNLTIRLFCAICRTLVAYLLYRSYILSLFCTFKYISFSMVQHPLPFKLDFNNSFPT